MNKSSNELLDYLSEHFYCLAQILDLAAISEQQFRQYQTQDIMPKPSYKVCLAITVDSYFGEHNETQTLEFYAKGYVEWLILLKCYNTKTSAFEYFSESYLSALNTLQNQGHLTTDKRFSEHLQQDVEQQWLHFIQGTYGLCTKTGLPDDIAAKELAIAQINQLIDETVLTPKQLAQLENAVNLLDQSSALFAPHERKHSSRHRLVTGIRQRFGFLDDSDK